VAFKAVVFDFDGVVLETEEPEYLAWREVWASFGEELEVAEWAACIGTAQGPQSFHPFHELRARSGLDLVEDDVRGRKQAIANRLLAATHPRPGIRRWLDEAAEAGLSVAIASSAERYWIDENLERIGLAGRFQVVACFDECRTAKPDPAPYLLACARLGVNPDESLAVEDSRNGLLSAKSAGLPCVVVPTTMTSHMDFSEADLVLDSLQQAGPLEAFLAARQLTP
jgi:HAD superfamily hydrolase (TIGR01509 family)